MWSVILIVCPLGIQPNPVQCRPYHFPSEAFMTEEQCWKRAGEMITKADPMLKPHGLESWRLKGFSCMPSKKVQA